MKRMGFVKMRVQLGESRKLKSDAFADVYPFGLEQPANENKPNKFLKWRHSSCSNTPHTGGYLSVGL